jgi:hypothetical protein
MHTVNIFLPIFLNWTYPENFFARIFSNSRHTVIFFPPILFNWRHPENFFGPIFFNRRHTVNFKLLKKQQVQSTDNCKAVGLKNSLICNVIILKKSCRDKTKFLLLYLNEIHALGLSESNHI